MGLISLCLLVSTLSFNTCCWYMILTTSELLLFYENAMEYNVLKSKKSLNDTFLQPFWCVLVLFL